MALSTLRGLSNSFGMHKYAFLDFGKSHRKISKPKCIISQAEIVLDDLVLWDEDLKNEKVCFVGLDLFSFNVGLGAIKIWP
jgi:hypothetical protein